MADELAPVVPPTDPPPTDEGLDPHDIQEIESKVVPNPRAGEKVVSKSALDEARIERKQLKKENARLAGEVAAMAPVVQQFKQIEPMLPQIAVWAQQMAEDAKKGTGPTASPTVPPKVAKMAERLGVDVGVAEKLYGVMAEIAQEEAGRLVDPVHRNVSGIRADDFRQRAYAAKEPDGRAVASREVIDRVFDAIAQTNPALLADPGVANVALIIARGLEPRTSAEPLLSEIPGRLGGGLGLTAFDKRAAELRGVSADHWQKTLRQSDSLILEE